MKKVLVIGAQNIDIYSRSKTDFELQDSNKAKVEIGFGGVACNIATNLRLLGDKISLLTVFGDDYFSELAKQNLNDLGIDIKESRIVENTTNSIYLGVMDKNNDLFLGLNDMDLIDKLDIDFIKEKSKYIEYFEILVIDNNLSYESLEYLLTRFKDKIIIMDAVSAVKAVKLNSLLPNIDILKVNLIELNALSKKENINDKLIDLINRGLSAAILTNSEKEIIYKSKVEKKYTIPIEIRNIKNATGAGDAFVSGFIHSFMRNKPIELCLETAKQIAHECLNSPVATICK